MKGLSHAVFVRISRKPHPQSESIPQPSLLVIGTARMLDGYASIPLVNHQFPSMAETLAVEVF